MASTGKGKGPLVADRRYAGREQAQPKAAKPRAAAKAAPRRPVKRRGLISGLIVGFFALIWRIVWGIGWRVGLLVGLAVAATTFYFYAKLPPVTDLLDGRARGSVTFLDTNGAPFAWRGETFGGQVTADTVSPNLLHAVVATEDKRFYYHMGISPRGIASAIRINLAEGRGPFEGNGGSTITQQVAKLLCLGVAWDPTQWKDEAAYEADCRKGSLMRKIKEVPFALAMELKYSKTDILTIYFNRAYLGAHTRGFEAASQRYFGKSARDVDASAEAAMLAGLLKAPSYYAPTNNLERSRERAAVIIGLMQEQGYLTKEEAAEALAHPAELSEAAQSRSGGFFADWVMETAPTFLTTETTEDVVIATTLDQRVQKAAEEALAFVFETKVKEGSKAQAAIVVMSADGAVRAMVGGRKIEAAGSFNRATQALRQTGSAFKPFVYAAALDMGWSPWDTVEDTPLTITTPGSGPWSPSNYDDEFKGTVTLVQALKESRNIPAVRVSEAVGRENVRTVAAAFGLKSDLAAGPALALGASESTLLEMTGACRILNGGSSVTPYGIDALTLQGETEPLLGAGGGIGERVISQEAAEELIFMMTQVVEGGTGGRARLPDREVAGKTGTTQAARDAWFVGFSADYVAGVWMGYDDNTPLTGVTGGGLAAEIWHEVMLRVHEGVEPKPLPMIVPERLGAGAGGGHGLVRQCRGREEAQGSDRDILRGILGGDN
ncbi:MAG: PBP1A family penicillin-binding protein [Exiguobacterium profundum]|nr:MAG: PBP1A family penicillin-binding protein [Exiguobacterium profundum]